MPSSKSSLDKRDVYYRKGKSDGECGRSATAGRESAAGGALREDVDWMTASNDRMVVNKPARTVAVHASQPRRAHAVSLKLLDIL